MRLFRVDNGQDGSSLNRCLCLYLCSCLCGHAYALCLVPKLMLMLMHMHYTSTPHANSMGHEQAQCASPPHSPAQAEARLSLLWSTIPILEQSSHLAMIVDEDAGTREAFLALSVSFSRSLSITPISPSLRPSPSLHPSLSLLLMVFLRSFGRPRDQPSSRMGKKGKCGTVNVEHAEPSSSSTSLSAEPGNKTWPLYSSPLVVQPGFALAAALTISILPPRPSVRPSSRPHCARSKHRSDLLSGPDLEP